jgi:hypothetical protein
MKIMKNPTHQFEVPAGEHQLMIEYQDPMFSCVIALIHQGHALVRVLIKSQTTYS